MALCIRTAAGIPALAYRPITAWEHYAAAIWLSDSPERIAYWRDEAAREFENHA